MENEQQFVDIPKMVSKLVERTKYNRVMFLGDDTLPQDNFIKEAALKMDELPDGWGVVGLNTEPGNPLAHWMADKRMLQLIPGGEFFPLDPAV